MLHQGLALAIAVFTFLQLLRGKWPRHVLTLAAGGLMVVVVLLGVMGSLDAVMEALSVDSFGKPQFWFAHGGVTERNVGINWSTVLFLVGMMVMVEGMSEAGFFDWLCLRLAKSLGFRPMPLLLSFMAVRPCCPCLWTASPWSCFWWWPPSGWRACCALIPCP